ncbi:MAG TPA: twin-arginine translocation signal domain-containing protein, partial [Candidatus Methanoperedens sp.]
MKKDEMGEDTLKNSVEVRKNDLNAVKKNAIMQMTRRKFVQLAGATAAALALGRFSGFDMMPTAAAFYNSSGLSKFTQPLRGVGPGAIPVAVPDRKWSWDDGKIEASHYTIDINQYKDKLHPDLGKTTLWGYNPRNALGVKGIPDQKHLGGIIVAERGIPIQITFQNNLPNKHILPVDPTIMGAEGNQVNRTSVHIHGGEVPWISDGGPFSWFDNAGHYGESVSKKGSQNIFKVLNPKLKPGQAEYYYPNQQSARFVWYHDHAVGITRLNAYAGIASGYIIRDLFERSLKLLGLPDFIENGG